jgi:hypothetical protein
MQYSRDEAIQRDFVENDGGPNGIRTRVTDVRGRCPNH